MKPREQYTNEELEALRKVCRERITEALLNHKASTPGPISENTLRGITLDTALHISAECNVFVSIAVDLCSEIVEQAKAQENPAHLLTFGQPGHAEYAVPIGSVLVTLFNLN